MTFRWGDNSLIYQIEMRKGNYDITLDGPHLVAWRMANLGHAPLVKFPGSLEFVVIVKKDQDKVKALKDMAGRSICALPPPNLATLTVMSEFGNPSRQPHLIGVPAFADTYKGVVSGQCIGGILQAKLYFNLDKDAKVAKVIFDTKPLPNQAFTVGPRVTAEMRDKIKLAILLVSLSLVLVSSSCGKVPLGPVGLKGENVLAAVRDLAKAYERRDLDAFMEKVSTAYPDREAFQTSVEKVFATYQTISFKLNYTKMLVMIQDKGSIKATFTWEGEWRSSGGKIVKDGARVTLVLNPARTSFSPSKARTPICRRRNRSRRGSRKTGVRIQGPEAGRSSFDVLMIPS